MKASDSSPNYMKATSSSAARKELSPVSSLNSQTSSGSKKVGRRESSRESLGSASTNKPTKNLPKSSSFELVRSLTKTASFKPVRVTAKRCAKGVALCKQMTAEKSTCSSTLKDSKFPAHLMLSPGATEAEGTSIMKACRYTYCSLNGHHHNPVPPLKCFLKARRHSLETQHSMKLEVLSPRKAKPSRVAKEKSDDGLLGFEGDQSLNEDAALVVSVPISTEVSTDFFIEIYANNTEDSTTAVDKSTEEKDVETADLNGGPGVQNSESCFEDDNEAAAEEGNIDQVADRLSDASAESEIQVKENFEQIAIIDSEEMDSTITESPFDENESDMDVAYSTILAEEEATAASPDSRSDIEDYITEATDMMWEEGQYFVSETDAEAYYSDKTDDGSLANDECTVKIKKVELHEEREDVGLDDTSSTCTEEILDGEILKVFFEESTFVVVPFNDSNYEMDSVANSEHAFEVLEAMEEKDKDAEIDFSSTLMKSASMGVTDTESEEAGDKSKIDELSETENAVFQTSPQPRDGENDCSTDMKFEVPDPFPTLYADDQDEALTNDEQDNIVHKTEELKLDEIAEYCTSSKDLADESVPVRPQGQHGDEHHGNTNVIEKLTSFREDRDENSMFKVLPSSASVEHPDSNQYNISLAGNNSGEEENMEELACSKSATAESVLMVNSGINPESVSKYIYTRKGSKQELPDAENNRRWTTGCMKLMKDGLEEKKDFNPKGPNFLPFIPGPEAEKVDLRHQTIDEKKNAEEWMIDYALQQTVTKLAPARKKKVALLVEAFETVLPIPKYKPSPSG